MPEWLEDNQERIVAWKFKRWTSSGRSWSEVWNATSQVKWVEQTLEGEMAMGFGNYMRKLETLDGESQ